MSWDGGELSHNASENSVRLGHMHSLVEVEPPPRIPSVVKLPWHEWQRGASRTCAAIQASELVCKPCRCHEILG